MMYSGAARIGDTTTGHGDFPSQVILTGKAKVLINGIPASTLGDAVSSHCNPIPSCHSSEIATGSSKVLIMGSPAARIGDSIGCGGVVLSGSTDVLIG